MGYREYQPHADLRADVQCFWSIDDPPSPDIQEVWPDGRVELLFTPGNCFLIAPDGSARPFPTASVLGLQTSIIRVRTDGPVRIFGARMLPSGIGGWTGPALRSLGARVQPLLPEARFPEAVAIVQQWLLRHPPASSELAASIRTLYSAAGNVTVAALARSQATSSRQLQRRFALDLGLSPKSLARLVRFAESWSRLLQKPGISLAELALELGYADQAHFSNEFNSFAKQPPGRFRRTLTPEPSSHSPSSSHPSHFSKIEPPPDD